jgi:hypothetical protein
MLSNLRGWTADARHIAATAKEGWASREGLAKEIP